MTRQEQSFLMAKRLRSLREERKLSCIELKKALFEQYGISISRDSLMSYEIQTEHHSKIKDGKYPNLNMGVEYLNAFAQFYNVSVDWLLGRDNAPVVYGSTVSEAAVALGITDEAANQLKELTGIGYTASAMDEFITSPHFRQIVFHISNYIDRVQKFVSIANNPASEQSDIHIAIGEYDKWEYYASKALGSLFADIQERELNKNNN